MGLQIGETPSAGPVGVPDSAYGARWLKAFNTEDTEKGDRERRRDSDDADGLALAERRTRTERNSRAPAFLKKKRTAAEKHAMQLKPGEVVVGRRLYRSGQSEYLINGRVARLRDIQDLFMGIGLGPDSYAIIEQGRIGQILSSKPTDRRAIIEEAAGITKFKTKRRLSEAKLESSKVNLSRVNDIYVEVEKQLASLKRQASKARRYAEIREQMRGLLRQVLASKAKELDLEADRLAGLLGGISQQESTGSSIRKPVGSGAGAPLFAHLRTRRRTAAAPERTRANGARAGPQRESHSLQQPAHRGTDRTAAANDRGNRAGRGASRASGNARRTRMANRSRRSGRSRARRKRSCAVWPRPQRKFRARTIPPKNTSPRCAAPPRNWASSSRACTESRPRPSRRLRITSKASRVTSSRSSNCSKNRCIIANAQAADLHWESVLERSRRPRKNWCATAQARIADLRHQQQDASTQVGLTRDALAGGRARRASVEQILNERSYTADAVQKLFASSQGGEWRRGLPRRWRARRLRRGGTGIRKRHRTIFARRTGVRRRRKFRRRARRHRHAARRSGRPRHVFRGFDPQTEFAAERARCSIRF